MTTDAAAPTDTGFGLGILFAALSGLAALGMLLAGPTELAGWAFAVAMVFGSLSVAAIHAYGA